MFTRTEAAKSGRTHSTVRGALAGLLGLLALNAFGGGYYGLAGAEGVPLRLLEGSPFRDYFVPSLILVVVVGGSALAAAIAVFAFHRVARVAALGAGTILLGWIALQVWVIGFSSWLQPAAALYGMVLVVLSTRLSSSEPRALDVRKERVH